MSGKSHFQQRDQDAAVRAVVVGEQQSVILQIAQRRKQGEQQCGAVEIRRLAAVLAVDLRPAAAAQPILARPQIDEHYAAVIKDPQATITLRTYAPQEVFVDGWVNNPGLVRSDVPLTVSRAIAQAGGTKGGAHTDAILVFRRTADSKIHYYQVALGNYAGAGSFAEDPLLSSYDVVYVPQTIFASLQDFLVNYVKNVPFYVNYQIQ